MAPPLPVTIALGMGTALFLSYCVYFDWKRVSHPDYKKRVRERRRQNRLKNATAIVPCANNQASLEEYFLCQMRAGEEAIKLGQVDDALQHFTNAIVLCAHPGKVVNSLTKSLSRRVHRRLVRKLQAMKILAPAANPQEDQDDDDDDDDNAGGESAPPCALKD
ncbi:hypothetical protein KR018_006479 [Drosophila ironensis]|nr:hypothetical protein KR018_006479 [Drosophila ironensis]